MKPDEPLDLASVWKHANDVTIMDSARGNGRPLPAKQRSALREKSDANRTLYEQMLPTCMTTFYLPFKPPPQDEELPDGSVPAGTFWDNYVAKMPFPAIRIVRREAGYRELRGGVVTTETICVRGDYTGSPPNLDWGTVTGDNAFFWVARDVYTHPNEKTLTAYATSESAHVAGLGRTTRTVIPGSFIALIDSLRDRKVRYVETPVTRQQRRAIGYAPAYREYVVIPTGDVRASEPNAMRFRDIAKAHPMLHAVRGHLRTYRAARYVNVQGTSQMIAPFTRGKGDLLQVKEYVERRIT